MNRDSPPSEFGDAYAASQIARRESGFRTRIKQFYLDRIPRHARGPTVDVGCGAGQLLEQLPPDSIGLEVNPALVQDLKRRGLDVMAVASGDARVTLGDLQPGRVRTALLSHVLEHFSDAAGVLRQLMHDCAALGITRLIVVVPGRVGHASDATHRTFVTIADLREHGLLEGADFTIAHRSWFPGNVEFIGRWFIYHELMLLDDLVRKRVDGPV